MSEELRIAVLVQGPILSRGRTLRDVSKKEFDSSESILSIFSQAKSNGFEFIFVKWAGEALPASLLTNIPESSILNIEFPKVRMLFRVFNNWKVNSKYRQFWAISKGLDYLQEKNIDYVIKVRSDSELNLKNLESFISSLDPSLKNNTILIPFLNVEKPALFSDYYFASDILNFKKFVNVVLYRKELYSNIHFDVFYKWAIQNSEISKMRSFLALYFPEKERPNASSQRIVQNAWMNCFYPLPRNIYEDFTWRGERFGDYADCLYLFSDDVFDVDPYISHKLIEQAISESFSTMKVATSRNYLGMVTFLLSSRIEDSLLRLESNWLFAIRTIKNMIKKFLTRRWGTKVIDK